MTIKNKLVYLQVIQELMDEIKYNLSFTTQNTSKNPSITCINPSLLNPKSLLPKPLKQITLSSNDHTCDNMKLFWKMNGDLGWFLVRKI